MVEFHSTRIFPKGTGASGYRLTGMAARCDWALTSDHAKPKVFLRKRAERERPRHVYMSLRNAPSALEALAEVVLPTIRNPFVLISGSEDVTLPRQTDKRFAPFGPRERGFIDKIVGNPFLIHWFAENLDARFSEKVSALPVGMVYPDSATAHVTEPAERPPTATRPCRILCGHRVREGEQWQLRRDVSKLAETDWAPWCTHLSQEVSEAEYTDLIKRHAFVLCVEGGGLDPSPKAWQSILHGAIPIIRRSAASEAYSALPVAYVDAWDASALAPDRLAAWQADLAPWHDTHSLRAKVQNRLGLDYWWDKIEDKLRPGGAFVGPQEQQSQRSLLLEGAAETG